ncbi:putative protease [Butyrivibrio hungatei DSM 14810]|uniref:Putative protease n=1 Tax=Butyrivibrio hungatei DSM 14810 TaxID=1121132 RepID=A0A1M7SBE4_9FIRM|nr:U32 family peptidase [Butyrivibrio hungatei]SHN55826.1 putative protease [Butyrivibrio hungatei DSM 14810]
MVELLAPAGGYETMVGAFNAGADAVYLGGSKFGARAYADNFDKEQVLDAISYAHLHGKKIYMTVNTLVKEREYGEVYDFMLPFAEKKLDGVIVQDLGVMKLIRDEFPKIELHGSTQQTVTGVYGAKLLKELGCVRVVPARELSLSEMKSIKQKADIEVEAFIHGAMCYCYSGMCLFSSMVGTRSGNRGRCAQPCRLPYRSDLTGKNKEQYPLSLKDMCTVDLIPELIEAGIDSFKIEGRMKKPEYAAGVTHIYRKYIDLYYKEPDKKHEISREDMEILRSLYLRTEISQGYYHKHNGKDMVTLASPAYNGTSDAVLADIKDRFLGGELKIKCDINCKLSLDEDIYITMSAFKGAERIVKEIRGSKVQAASKRPMDKESVYKQLSRLGNTPFEAENISISIDDKGNGAGIFVPVSELNELRRTLCEELEKALLTDEHVETIKKDYGKSQANEKESLPENVKGDVHILVTTKDQLEVALKKADEYSDITRIYVDSNLYQSLGNTPSSRGRLELMVALPYMTRTEQYDGVSEIERILDSLGDKGFDGVLVRNLEQLGFLHDRKYSGKVILDYGIYIWNGQAAEMLKDLACEASIPYELTFHEAKEVSKKVRQKTGLPETYNIYGYTPMMISAGCVKKTLGTCSGFQNKLHSEKLSIYDRMDNELKITTNCLDCYNIIWNAHPTSLHKKLTNIQDAGCFDHYRIDMSVESQKECADIISYYLDSLKSESVSDIFENAEYTTGHFKRGVE